MYIKLIALLFLFGCSFNNSFFTNKNAQKENKINTKSVAKKNGKRSEVKVVTILKPAKKKVIPKNTAKVLKYCKKIDKKFKKYRWGKSGCEKLQWHHVRNSVLGTPLIWATYGDEISHKKSPKNMTVLFCGVHGDEITPIRFCFHALQMLEKYDDKYFEDKLIVVAPIVNPDSFFKRRPTRTNQRKVDINRNFPTKDWNRLALKMWKRRYGSDKRRFPGKKSLSEPEVLFQMNLIKRYSPDKLVSVHAPLTMWDYDGPGETKKSKTFRAFKELEAKRLLLSMSKKAKNYRIKDYPFFPGSLGNWAGNERQIPTYTLELPSSDYTKSAGYWKLFRHAIADAFNRDIRDDRRIAKQDKKKESKN